MHSNKFSSIQAADECRQRGLGIGSFIREIAIEISEMWECIFHCGFNNGHEIPQFWHFLQISEMLTFISRINEPGNTKHVCTLLNAFLMMISNMLMKFQKCWHFFESFIVSSAQVCCTGIVNSIHSKSKYYAIASMENHMKFRKQVIYLYRLQILNLHTTLASIANLCHTRFRKQIIY